MIRESNIFDSKLTHRDTWRQNQIQCLTYAELEHRNHHRLSLVERIHQRFKTSTNITPNIKRLSQQGITEDKKSEN